MRYKPYHFNLHFYDGYCTFLQIFIYHLCCCFSKFSLNSFAHLLIVGVHFLGGHWLLATRAKGAKAESRVQMAVRMTERMSVVSCRDSLFYCCRGKLYKGY